MEEFHSASSPKSSALPNARFITFCDPRNDDDYDTFEYGTEPIPSDTSWVRPTTLTQLFHKIIAKLELADTVDSQKLARLVIHEILSLPTSTLLDLKAQDPSFNDPNAN